MLPIIPNIELFGGTVFHSREYHDPEVYANKVVVVVGCGPSAVDISLEIASVAREVSKLEKIAFIFANRQLRSLRRTILHNRCK